MKNIKLFKITTMLDNNYVSDFDKLIIETKKIVDK